MRSIQLPITSTVSYYCRDLDLGLPTERSKPRPIGEAFLILRAWGHLKSMPLLQWVVLLVLGFIPVFVLPNLPLSVTIGPFDLPQFVPLWKTVGAFDFPIKSGANWVWFISVLVFVPTAFREDRSRAEQSIDFKLEGPQRDIQRLTGKLEKAETDLQEQKEQLAEMDRAMRAGFGEAGITIPPRRMSLRASFAFDVPQVSVTLHTSASRLVRWVKRPALGCWKWFWG